MTVCRSFLFLTFDLAKSLELATRLVALEDAVFQQEEQRGSEAFLKNWDIALHLCPMLDTKSFFEALHGEEYCANENTDYVSDLVFTFTFPRFLSIYNEYLKHLESDSLDSFKYNTIVQVAIAFDSDNFPCHRTVEKLRIAYAQKDESFSLRYYFDLPFFDLAGAIAVDKGIETKYSLAVSSSFNTSFAMRGDTPILVEQSSSLEDVKYALNLLFLISGRIKARQGVEEAFLSRKP